MTPLELLENLPISSAIAYQDLKEIAEYSMILEYKKDEVLYSKEITFDYIGIIISGKVTYYVIDPISKKGVHLGSFKRYPVGMFNFSKHKEEDVYIKAVEATQILAVDLQSLPELEDNFPMFTHSLYKSLIALQMSIMKRILNSITKLTTKAKDTQ